MEKGDLFCNFEILETINLDELKAKGIWARHKSGAEVFHVLNDDSENLFAFAFTTAVDNSTGVAHILEHSVLCGSEKYPLKDAFLTLAQGSLQTFLNAWTFPDKTVYPASSVNEKDYFNLMSVYADAVFRPLLSEWTFMQEGWRIAPSKTGLEYTGIVYNEMKGAYSSMDTYAGIWSIKGVMPGTPYSFESGGDPDHIPSLNWNDLKEFHRARYDPANCRIFLAGNIPTEKQLAFLDKNCLALSESGKAAASYPKTIRWEKPAFIRVPCPGKREDKPQAMLSWLCTDTTETKETLSLACLAEILLGHDGSPLTRALVESGLGEDICPSTGLETELRETVFTAGLRGIQKENAESTYNRMEALILEELRRLVKEGIPKEEIEAALLSMEFSHREIKRSHGPFSLVWMRRSLRGWVHGTTPWESLLFAENFSALKERSSSDNGYFESLIEKYFLQNPHRALIAIEGEADYLEKKESAMAASLKEKELSLSKAEKKELKERAAKLEKIQKQTDTKAAIESIPHLSLQDLTAEIEPVPTELIFLNSVERETIPCMTHPIFTNGITYANFAFPLDILEPEDYRWLPFFSRSVVSMGLPGMDYGKVSSLVTRTMGGFHALLETGSSAPQNNAKQKPLPEKYLSRDWIIYCLKALDSKAEDSFDLALRLITEADFSDLRRLRDLMLELKNDSDSSLAPLGSNYASSRSGKRYSRSRAVDEIWNGLDQLTFSHQLASMNIEEVRDRMIHIRDSLVKGGLFINLTADGSVLPSAIKSAEKFTFMGGPQNAKSECVKKESFFSLLQNKEAGAEVYASDSLQVGFAAMSLPCSPYGSPEQAVELVLSHELSYGALWESIRMMGGAYGAHAYPDNLEGVFSFSTYRDPDPLRSLEAIPAILKKRGKTNIDQDSLEKVIIGTYSKEIRPRTPSEKGFSEFSRRLYGINDSHRLSRLKQIIALTANDTCNAAARLASSSAKELQCCPVIIAGKSIAEKAAKKLRVELKELPV